MPNTANSIQTQLLHSALPSVHAMRIDSAQPFAKHWHASHGFGVMELGGHRSASGRGVVDAWAGCVLTHNPGEVHDGVPLQGHRRRWVMLHLPTELLHSLGGRADDGHQAELEFTQPVLEDPQLVRLLQRLLHTWVQRPASEKSEGLARLADESALSVLCTHLLHRHSTARVALHAPAAMVRVRDWLAAAALNPPSLQAMAAPLGLSRYQLLRRFTEVYGLSPHGWLRAYRLEQARALIAQGKTLADTAAHSGFADQAHMSRAFRATLGYSPGRAPGAQPRPLQPRSRHQR